jgi:hypothetical protein
VRFENLAKDITILYIDIDSTWEHIGRGIESGLGKGWH